MATTTRNQVDDFDVEYDTDSISITSTQESVHSDSHEYEVEEIICEYTSQDNDEIPITKYLVRWTDYPMHKCTWEPVENLENTTLLDDWDMKIVHLGEEAACKLAKDNLARYHDALEKYNKAKQLRRNKRAKKRARKKSTGKATAAIVDIDSDSDSDTPLIIRRNRNTQNGKSNVAPAFTRETRQRPTPEPHNSSPLSSSDSDTSADCLLEQLRIEGLDSQRRNAGQQPVELIRRPTSTANRSASSKSTEKRRVDPVASSHKQPQSKTSSTENRGLGETSKKTTETAPSLGQGSVHKSRQINIPVAAATATATAPRRRSSKVSAELSKGAAGSTTMENAARESRPVQYMRKSAPNTAPIKMVNKPKTALRAAWHKDGDQSYYSSMHFRRKGELRGRYEQTPDVDVLEFVNAPSTNTSRAPQANNHPCARRDSTSLRRDYDRDDSSSPPATDAPEWDKDKVPQTCFDWRGGSCIYSAMDCKFLHRDTDEISSWNGRVPPKYARPKVTCYFYMKNRCSNTAKQCDFAHYNTGWLSDGSGGSNPIDPSIAPRSLQHTHTIQQADLSIPGAIHPNPSILDKDDLTCYFWMRGATGCRLSETKCMFSHRNTGWLFQARKEPVVRIDASERPVSLKSRMDNAVSKSKSHRPRPDELTCYFWSDSGRCNKGNKCMYRHYNTGMVADAPSTKLMSKAVSSHQDVARPLPPRIVDVRSGLDTATSPEMVTIDDDWDTNVSYESRVPQTVDKTRTLGGLSSAQFKEMVETACKLDFTDMFGNDGEGGFLNGKAFLVYHPGDHAKQMELIARWLLLHDVEVCSFWLDGSWEYFKQDIMGGGSGVIIAHPDFENYSEIPDFGQILKGQVRLWSVGLQCAVEYDAAISTMDPVLRYDRVEMFPHGGIIYITDEVFDQEPEKALKIFELFFSRVERCRQVNGPIDPSKCVDDGCLLWRLATRPDLMESIWKECIEHENQINAQDPVQSCRAKLYDLLDSSGYVEQQHQHFNRSIRADDYFPVMSARPEFLPDYFKALDRSQEEANRWMVEMYAGLVVDRRRDYRQYFVVHTQPSEVSWKDNCQNMDEIMTPQECIEYFEQPAKGNRFEFYDWAFSEKTHEESMP
ncbi:hypothetical protein K504DRAFT_465972 [Pleomassaria siparia CBS 279.74]|uniref:Chromo domain-containing protein n=1 Tax=Pleomassaria siparia CBS 279.74 TaxID=1314801 RepID=A0A6G1KDT5_9PLEO|nr:hypothetical protein K504DRAFT_465972 [Pleomassaria siparia CBS 279.74]